MERDKMRRHGEREKEMPRQRGTKIWGEITRGRRDSEKRHKDRKVEGQVTGGASHWPHQGLEGRETGRGERPVVQESAEWAPIGPPPTILSEAPTSRGEGALCPHSVPPGTWGAVCFGGDPCWNQSK